MPSSATTRLRLEKQALGENLNTWGAPKLNTGLDLIEEAIAGVEAITISATTTTLTSTNYASDQARNACLVLSGTLTANSEIIVPSVEKLYLVINGTTMGAYTLTVKTSGGSGYSLRAGAQWVYCNATNVAGAMPTLNQLPVATGAVDLNGQTLSAVASLAVTGTATFGTGIGIAGKITGVATPVDTGDGANKAYVDAAVLGASGSSPALPGQGGNRQRTLLTDGTNPFWGRIIARNVGTSSFTYGTDGSLTSYVEAQDDYGGTVNSTRTLAYNSDGTVNTITEVLGTGTRVETFTYGTDGSVSTLVVT